MNLSSRILDMRPPRIATSLVLAAALLHYVGPPQRFELPRRLLPRELSPSAGSRSCSEHGGCSDCVAQQSAQQQQLQC